MSLEIDITKKLGSFTLDVDFDLGDETLGFLGASGCGKSMTLRCVAGVETPDEGRIVVNGVTYFDSEKRINLSPQERKTALLFQNFQLFPHMTVEKNIAAGIPRSAGREERDAMVRSQVHRFALEGLEKRYPLHLSGGQQQRVALARMLAARPAILMLDEPFSALDSHLKLQLEQDLLELFDSFEGSIMYVSHDIDEAFRFCDRIAVVDEGKIREIGKSSQIVEHPHSLATIKLSGCRNTSAATRVDAYHLRVDDWGGIELVSSNMVPQDLAYIGIREFHLSKAAGEDHNVVTCEVLRISDSRYECTVGLVPVGHRDDSEQIIWQIDKLLVPKNHLPHKGDVVDVYFDERQIFMVNG